MPHSPHTPPAVSDLVPDEDVDDPGLDGLGTYEDDVNRRVCTCPPGSCEEPF